MGTIIGLMLRLVSAALMLSLRLAWLAGRLAGKGLLALIRHIRHSQTDHATKPTARQLVPPPGSRKAGSTAGGPATGGFRPPPTFRPSPVQGSRDPRQRGR